MRESKGNEDDDDGDGDGDESRKRTTKNYKMEK
jgi:hypothetical protein